MVTPPEVSTHDIHNIQIRDDQSGLEWHETKINGQYLQPMLNRPDGLKYLYHGHADIKSYVDEVWRHLPEG